ncbi:MAG: hypothetical protein EOO38_21590 [Cytophagaceae bacterium]|nr:MAG: hypothetical protein EOO38_21590 [Cytophagaceae bacterium]
MLGQKSAIRPGSIFHRQGGSVFNQRQQAKLFKWSKTTEAFISLVHKAKLSVTKNELINRSGH